MSDIRYIYSEWQNQLDALDKLVSGWGSVEDSLVKANKNLKNIDDKIDKEDVDRAISFYHTDCSDDIDTLCDNFAKLKNYCKNIGDEIKDNVDTPFYNKMDDFAQSLESISINEYTTENTLNVTDTIYTEVGPVDYEKSKINIQDILNNSSALDSMLKDDYNDFMSSSDIDEDISYEDYKTAITYSRSFDYNSIEDQQITKEFWVNLAIGVGIIIVGIICPPAGIALGIAYGTLELSSAVSGQDWLTGRELGTGERVMRGAFALLDIIPGVKALSSSMQAARTATRTLGQADNAIMVMGKYSLQRVKSGISQMGKIATNTKSFVKLFVSNVDEGIRLLATKAKTLGTRAVSAAKSTIDDVGRSIDDMIAKGNRILQGDFSDIKNYFKNFIPGDTVLVQLSNGDVISMPRSTFDAGDANKALSGGYQYNMVENPGPLVEINQGAAATFESGKYNIEVLTEPKVVYRAGEAGSPLGQYFTSEPPISAIEVRIDSAVKPQWIDSKTGALTGTSYVDTVYAIELPAGTTMYIGPAGYQGDIYLGGKEQIFVSQPWNIDGVSVRDSWSIK